MNIVISSANGIYRFMRRDRPRWEDVATPVLTTLMLLCALPAWFYGEAFHKLSRQFFDWSIQATLSSLLDWRFAVVALLFCCIAGLAIVYATAAGFLASILGKRMIGRDDNVRAARDEAED